MPLPTPNLDDRDFAQLVEEARRRIVQTCPTWTDLSPSDPGTVLLELFAHLTETLIYRLNRVPTKAYTEFLNLIGVRMYPPAAAQVTLRFSRPRAEDRPLEIPRGTRVTLGRGEGGSEPPVFVTADSATIASGATEVDVLAHNCDLIVAELAGLGSGLPGQTVSAQRPPLVAPTRDELDLVVGVEARPDELDERVPAVRYADKTYRVWREVTRFSNPGDDRFVYVVDRMAGTITFAPAVQMTPANGTPLPLAEVPAAGREIRLWYRRGGGPQGNVAAGTLTVLKDPIAGVEVTNPAAATGGRAAETLENALVRGPEELYTLERAVTARDYELVAQSSSRAVARARAFTKALLWQHAAPGTVELLLVPYLPEDERGGGRVTAAALQQQEVEETRDQIQRALDARRPLGTTCLVNWARYKTVRVSARIVVRRQEDPAAVRQRVLERLHLTINPLPTQFNSTGWRFGQALRASNVYEIALWEPGVRWIDSVRLLVDEVPERNVASVRADGYQPDTWYAGSEETLFRSLNDGDGWEPAGRFPGEQVEIVRPHPGRAGYLAVATRLPENGGTRLHVSRDCGETWESTAQTAFNVEDMAWTLRDGVPVLLLATDVGLYELAIAPDSGPVQVLVDPADQDRGFYAVVAFSDSEGELTVAVAARSTGGIYLSSPGGRPPYRPIGRTGEDIRVLAVQSDSVRRYLWAGAAAPGGDDPGTGCVRREVTRAREVTGTDGWQAYGRGWTGGSCRSIAFQGTNVLAASHHAGVLRLDTRGGNEPAWRAPDVTCGLPLRDREQFLFHPVDTVAVDPEEELLVAGGLAGVFRSRDGGAVYEPASSKEFRDTLTLPGTWLFCSGEHDVNVVSEDAIDGH